MRHAVFAAIVLVVLYTFFAPKSVPQPTETGPVAVALKSASKADRLYIAALYDALADVLRRDAGRNVTTTSAWRAIHSASLRLAVGGTPLKGKYPGLDRAVEETLSKYYGLEDVALTPELIKQIIAACEDVEAQCRRS